jgi:hypothetical protein
MFGILKAVGESINRIAVTYQLHRRWFGKDKPDRERLGYREGLYPQEYSAADKERLGINGSR